MSFEIGIICAIEEERAALAAAFGLAAEPAGGPFPILGGEAYGIRLHLAQAGIGKANAAALAAHLLTRSPTIALMAFSGVAGGMRDDLHPGDLVLAEAVATHDYGAVRAGRLDWYPTGEFPFGPPPRPVYRRALTETPALARAEAGFKGRLIRGRIISGDVFLNCRETRDRLEAAWSCDAIDMESAAFADTCARFGKPTLVLRTISDRACEESHVSFQETAEAAAANSAGFLAAFVRELAGDGTSQAILKG